MQPEAVTTSTVAYATTFPAPNPNEDRVSRVVLSAREPESRSRSALYDSLRRHARRSPAVSLGFVTSVR
jgi:hypothetical protein